MKDVAETRNDGDVEKPGAFHDAAWYHFWYQAWYVSEMPSLNVSFTDEELAAVRQAASADEVSLRAFAHAAIVAAADHHKRRVIEGAKFVAAKSAELNARLA